ncbi:MAG: hypothetical protein QXF38_01255, partial [Pyrobaculum sp.]
PRPRGCREAQRRAGELHFLSYDSTIEFKSVLSVGRTTRRRAAREGVATYLEQHYVKHLGLRRGQAVFRVSREDMDLGRWATKWRFIVTYVYRRSGSVVLFSSRSGRSRHR